MLLRGRAMIPPFCLLGSVAGLLESVSEGLPESESFLESKVVPSLSDALTAGEDSSHARLLRGPLPLTEDLHDILRSLEVVVKPGTTTALTTPTNSSFAQDSSSWVTTTSTTKIPTEEELESSSSSVGIFAEEKTGEEDAEEDLGYGSPYCLSENILNPVAWRENDSEFHWRPEDDSPGHTTDLQAEEVPKSPAELQAQCTDYYQHLPAYASRGWQKLVTKTGRTLFAAMAIISSCITRRGRIIKKV